MDCHPSCKCWCSHFATAHELSAKHGKRYCLYCGCPDFDCTTHDRPIGFA